MPFSKINSDIIKSFDIDYNNEFEKLINKIDRLEKSIRILENRVNKLENKKENNNQFYNDEPTDMYMI